ncbi:hypothetical protein EX30DRAFT_308325, partial [Ascodesmis nigricans]
KKKWSKGKVKDKAQHAVVMDKNIQDRLNKDVLTYRLITTAVLVDRLKINGSLARKALADLEERGVIKKIVGHSKLSIYSTTHRFPQLDTLSRRVLTEFQRGLLRLLSKGCVLSEDCVHKSNTVHDIDAMWIVLSCLFNLGLKMELAQSGTFFNERISALSLESMFNNSATLIFASFIRV